MTYTEYKLRQELKEFYYRNKLQGKVPTEMSVNELNSFVDKHNYPVFNAIGKYENIYSIANNSVQHRIPKKILTILRILTNISKESYLVGGCIRDSILQLRPKDFDFVTDIPYDNLVWVFEQKGWTIKETGKEFLVLNIIKDEEQYEIANFRKDGTYSDGRRPDAVEIGTFEDDANRRDFTINALYWNENGLIDPTLKGIDDITSKTLRFIGKPQDRIRDDYLRVFRFYRFITTKGLTPCNKSMSAVREMYNEAHINTTPERARVEIERML